MIDCLRVFAAAVCFVCVFLFVLPAVILFGILGGNLLRGERPHGSGDDGQWRPGGGKYKLRGTWACWVGRVIGHGMDRWRRWGLSGGGGWVELETWNGFHTLTVAIIELINN